jgi:hypothetical protein
VFRLDSANVPLFQWHRDGTIDLYAMAHLLSFDSFSIGRRRTTVRVLNRAHAGRRQERVAVPRPRDVALPGGGAGGDLKPREQLERAPRVEVAQARPGGAHTAARREHQPDKACVPAGISHW